MMSCLLAQVRVTDWPMNEQLFRCEQIFDGAESLLLNLDTRCWVCPPDVGKVLKVIALHTGNSLETEEVTLEELQVFKVSVYFLKSFQEVSG